MALVISYHSRAIFVISNARTNPGPFDIAGYLVAQMVSHWEAFSKLTAEYCDTSDGDHDAGQYLGYL